jgi:membrane-bound serine protease (ClpP class)
MPRTFTVPALAPLVLASGLVAFAAPPAAEPPAPAAEASPTGAEAATATVYTITLDDAIHPITARYLVNAINSANRQDATLLIVRLDTPGGLQTSMEEMITAITHSHVPVVVFVHGSKAASAGFFLTLAADVAVMAPGTRIGAAHPVSAIGEIPKDSPMLAKIENDAAAYIRSIAANRGRNPVEAEKAVRESRAFTEKEALDLGLIDLVCNDEAQILAQLDGRTIRRFQGGSVTLRLAPARIESLDMSGSERFLSLLANPALAAILLFVGMLGIYVEITHPGLVAPGLIGGVCLLLFMLSTQTMPVNWVGLGLIVLGILMFLLEIKIVSYGALTAGGIACLVVGGMLLHRGMPGMPGLEAARAIVLAVATTAAIIMGALTYLVSRDRRRRPTTGASGLVAQEGTALTDLTPEGRVFVHGEYWNARARTPVRQGARVRVAAVDGLLLEVEEVR